CTTSLTRGRRPEESVSDRPRRTGAVAGRAGGHGRAGGVVCQRPDGGRGNVRPLWCRGRAVIRDGHERAICGEVIPGVADGGGTRGRRAQGWLYRAGVVARGSGGGRGWPG